ncbi:MULTISPECIES: acyltransferase [Pseudomonas]|uniref:Chloramphenicol acetyltransferase n=1 Tax=Pseudomonas haemolytica TaxID=2600065 RepID=A0A5P1D7D0_9PSED|nr:MULTISPECIES: acyltransferase [Pseudomonas]MBJ2247540.1 acyltransferase [Pseudomonas haemolytica]MBJ2272298.1 acyltransferase [Pseudomonas haemolytica]MBJ2282761.1 acyltransferase [Pseudomonas sp. MF6755]MBK3449976.1 acyltransferase [Pseudomonas haemolytica]MBK3461560.1 acyltransferase [Pseudomonas haemolytica]
MAFISEAKLKEMGFKSLGKNVKISDKASIYNCDRISIGDNTRIDDFCVISGTVTLGRNVHIAIFNNVAGGELGITMEDFSGLAYGCHVFAQSDDYSGKTLTNPTVPSQYKNEAKLPVHIGRHVIIGTSSIVLPGVTLAEGCSVGAMSMVTKSTDPWGIYFGVPAKRLKNRSQELLELEKHYLDSEK